VALKTVPEDAKVVEAPEEAKQEEQLENKIEY